MRRCCVEGCRSRSRDRGISMHEFPHSPTQAEEWKRRCDVVGSKKRYVCSRHFSKKDYRNRTLLVAGVPPHLNLKRQYADPPPQLNFITKVVMVDQSVTSNDNDAIFELHNFRAEPMINLVADRPSSTKPIASLEVAKLPSMNKPMTMQGKAHLPSETEPMATLEVAELPSQIKPMTTQGVAHLPSETEPMATLEVAKLPSMNKPMTKQGEAHLPSETEPIATLEVAELPSQIKPLTTLKVAHQPSSMELIRMLEVAHLPYTTEPMAPLEVTNLLSPNEPMTELEVAELPSPYEPMDVAELTSPVSPLFTGDAEEDSSFVNDGFPMCSTSHPTHVQNPNVNSKKLVSSKEHPKKNKQGQNYSKEYLAWKNEYKEGNCLPFLAKNLSTMTYEIILKDLKARKNVWKGRYWSEDDISIGVSLYKLFPKFYPNLSRMFFLPGTATILAAIKNVPFAVGLNPRLSLTLRSQSSILVEANRLCVLAFDEIKLKPCLEYDEDRDRVIGYDDLGSGDNLNKIATHALVFMALGINEAWKLPVAYYFIHKSISPNVLKVFILNAINFLFGANLTVVATICDRGVSNIAAINSLVCGAEKPMFGKTPVYFFFMNSLKSWKIFTIYDPPHLLKWTRNMLMQQDIQYGTSKDCKIASWGHIQKFYFDECYPSPFTLRLAPNLTQNHVQPSAEQKMRVDLAAEVFSYTVASGIMARVSSNVLPSSCLSTADFLLKCNNLFDSLNGSLRDPENAHKLYKTSIHENSKHENLFKQLLPCIESWQFLGAKTSSPTGWLVTIQAIWGLWECLRDEHGYQQMPTSRLNLDPVENLFSFVRQLCGCESRPTVGQFVNAIKTSMVRTQTTPKLINSYCQEDGRSMLLCLDSFLNSNLASEQKYFVRKLKSADKKGFIIPGLEFSDPICSGFISGYFQKIFLPSIEECLLCLEQFTDSIPKSYLLKHSNDGKTIVLACSDVIEAVMKAQVIFYKDQPEGILNQCFSGFNVVQNLVKVMKNEINFAWYTCSAHRNDVIDRLLSAAVKIFLLSWCKNYNRELVKN